MPVRSATTQYTPNNHKIVSVVALMDRQDEAAPFIQVCMYVYAPRLKIGSCIRYF